jgi:hypothetical protein
MFEYEIIKQRYIRRDFGNIRHSGVYIDVMIDQGESSLKIKLYRK